MIFIELLVKRSYLDQRERRFFYYRNSKKVSCLKLLNTEKFDIRQLSLLKSIKQKHKKVDCYALAATRMSLKDDQVEISPWECLA